MKGMKNIEKAGDQRRVLTKACRSCVHFVLLYVFSFDPKLQDSPKKKKRRPGLQFWSIFPRFLFCDCQKIHRHRPLVYCTNRRTQIPQRCDQYTSRFCTAKNRSSSDAPPVAWATFLTQKEDDDDPYLLRTKY